MQGRDFDKEKLEELQERYGEEYYDSIEGFSFLDRIEKFINQMFKEFGKFLGEHLNINVDPQLMEFLMYAFIAIGFAYLFLRLAGVEVKYLLPRRKIAFEPKSYEIEEEEIEKMDLDQMTLEAKQAGNYTLAIRYCYLNTLKVLSEKAYLRYEFKKTNRDYLQELNDYPLRERFLVMMQTFERSWYGHLPTDQTTYDGMNENFTNLKKELVEQR